MTAGPGSAPSPKLIEDRLADLPKDGGVWRDGLAGFLGEEICAHMHIVTTPQPDGTQADSADQIRAKVSWHLRRLVQAAINKEKVRQSARFRFNITNHSELNTILSPEDRVEWGKQRGLCLAIRTTSEHMAKTVVPDLSRELTRPQPVPPKSELDAIIAEFRSENSGEARASAPLTTNPPPASKPWHVIKSPGSRKIVLGTIAAFVIGVIVAVVGVVNNAAHTQAASPPAPDGANPPLLMTLTSFSNSCHAVIFPRNLAQAAAPFVNQTTVPEDKAKFMADTLKAGAYAGHDLIIHFDLQTALPQQVTVYNVRVAELKAAEPIKGSMVTLETCEGEPTSQMILLINKPDQGPFALDEYDRRINKHYFDSSVIQVAPGKKQTVVVDVEVDEPLSANPSNRPFAGSYVFKIALDIELDGQKSTVLLDAAGSPFRLTGGAGCPPDTLTGVRGNDDGSETPYKLVNQNHC